MRVRTIVLSSVLSFACTTSDADPASNDGTEGDAPTTGSSEESTTTASSSNVDDTSTTAAATTFDPTTESSGDSSTGEEVGTPGCRVAEPLAEGEHVFTLDGLERRYVVRLPRSYSTDQAWPLIFALHGNGGNPNYWDQTGGDRDIRTAFADEAILIIPEAINNAWRDYGMDASTWPAGMELELDFFDAVYETARNELCIDTGNVFSMGFSGGGSFSGVLGCRRDYIRAIAVGGSVIYFEQEDCTEKPAAWITIGDGELNGGRLAFRDFFVQNAGCDETSTPGEPEGCVDYDACDAGSPVTYCSHPADHVWPTIGTEATRAFFRSFYAP